MAPFPSPVESTVASALLLLSTTVPPSPPPPLPPPPPPRNLHVCFRWPPGLDGESVRKESESKRSSSSSEEESLSLESSASKSTSSCLTSDGSSKESRSRNLRVVAVVARCHEMKLKVVRRKRSEVSWSSDDRKVVPSLPMTVSSESTTTTEVSCLSSNSSAASRARSRFMSRGLERSEMMKASEKPKRRLVGSGPGLAQTHLRRRAEGILKMLSGGCFSEVRIRQVFGDSPDTSKALRILLKQEEIKRSGTGGRQDPYMYTISGENRELGQQC